MPERKRKLKAGKWTFLLVCLFLCSACGRKEAVFVAGSPLKLDDVVQEAEETVVAEEAQSKEEQQSHALQETQEAEESVFDGRININTADAQTLMSLPGIGESRAAAIIEHRQRMGAFEKIEEIMDVKGIGPGIFSKISNLICVK